MRQGFCADAKFHKQDSREMKNYDFRRHQTVPTVLFYGV